MMIKERKCIAVIISKPERKYQEGLLRGICKSAFARGMNVAVFATSILEGMEEYVWGEKEIYELINYKLFAGVVYALGSFYGNNETKELTKKIQEVAKSGIPVVSIDAAVEGIPSFFNDDSNAVDDIVDHFVKVHKLKDIAFMTGHKGFTHAENSLRSFINAMGRYGLEVPEDRVFYGNYWYGEGENFINQLQGSEKGYPEAIICANEYMAIDVYKGLHKRGIFVPKHILMGCTSNDADTAPYFLTAENSLENVGYEAGETIWRTVQGEKLIDETRFLPSKTELKPSVGCGCLKASAYDFSESRGIMVDTDPGFFGEINFSTEGMLFKKDYQSLFKSIDESSEHIKGFKGLYLCMCEGWDDPYFLIKDTKKNKYPDVMRLRYYRRELSDGPDVYIGQDKCFFTRDMFPGLFYEDGEPSIYVFRSLHFTDRNYGYIVLNNGQNSKVYDYVFNFWLHDVTVGLESQCRLQGVNYMFYTDIMTGLFNRNGFNTMLQDFYEDVKLGEKQILFALADLNNLKTINDNYGHEEGDVAIKAAASLLKNVKLEHADYEKNFRLGGDEFVKIAVGNFTGADLEHYKEKLYSKVADFSKRSNKPYKTEMSLGYSIGRPANMEEMEALLSQADKCMYKEKIRLKGPGSEVR